jgi:hypothetical protein
LWIYSEIAGKTFFQLYTAVFCTAHCQNVHCFLIEREWQNSTKKKFKFKFFLIFLEVTIENPKCKEGTLL